MNKLTVRIRTRDDLTQLLKDGASGWWKIAAHRIPCLAKVEIYNFEGTLRLTGDFNPKLSSRNGDNRLNVAFTNGKLKAVNPPYQWIGQNPIKYVEEGAEEGKAPSLEEQREVTSKIDLGNVSTDETKAFAKKLDKLFIKEKPKAEENPKKKPTLEEFVTSTITGIYREPVKILRYYFAEKPRPRIKGWFQEKRRGWFFDFRIYLDDYSFVYRPHPIIRNMSDETLEEVYPKLENQELELIYYLIKLASHFGGEISLLTEDEFTENEEDYGFSPQSECYPVILYRNTKLKVTGCFYLFRKSRKNSSLDEQMILDDNDDTASVFNSTSKALDFLVKRLEYYRDER